MKKSTRIFWGVCLLALGVILLGNNLGLFSISIFFKGWWTLFIIIPSAYGLFDKDSSFTSFIFLCIGVLLLLEQQKIIKDVNVFAVIVALIIIRIAFSLIFKKQDSSKKDRLKSGSLTAVFSGKDNSFTGNLDSLPDCVAVFGGVQVNLSNADFTNDIYLDAVAIFGGIDISVPENVNVVCKGVGIFGGAENKRNLNSSNEKTLYVNYTAIFGGVEIK